LRAPGDVTPLAEKAMGEVPDFSRGPLREALATAEDATVSSDFRLSRRDTVPHTNLTPSRTYRPQDMELLDAYWRAANYLSVGGS
jgi:hypothetical protein